MTSIYAVRRIVPRLLSRCAIPKMLCLDRLLQSIRLLVAKIARIMHALGVIRFVLRHRRRDDGDGAFDVALVHLVVFAQMGGFAVGAEIEEEGEETCETMMEADDGVSMGLPSMTCLGGAGGNVQCCDGESGACFV